MRKDKKDKMVRDKYYYDFNQSLEQQAREEMQNRGKRYHRIQMVWQWVTAMLIGAGVIGVLLAIMAVTN